MPASGTRSRQGTTNAGVPTPPKFSGRNEVFFENLLASAYSIQQKQDLIRSNVSTVRFNEILATVIDTGSLLRHPPLHLDTAMHMILSRIQKVSGASGAALYIAERGMIEYVAGSGIGLGLIGISFPESQSAFFTKVRTRPAIEWGEVEEPQVKERIPGFELRAPVCSGGKVVGCLKLFSRIRQFNPEIVHVCELMTAFLGEILEKQASPLAQEITQRSNESHLTTNSTGEGARVVPAAAPTTPTPVPRSEPKRNWIPINNQPSLRTVAPTGGQGPAEDSQTEEDKLPTIDELLGQLGVAADEGALLENLSPQPDQPSECDTVQITANVRSESPVVPIETTQQKSQAIRAIEPVRLATATDQPDKTRETVLRKIRSNISVLFFPAFTLVFCVSLSLTQTSLSSLFKVLTFLSIIFSVIEIWRAGYGKR